MYFAKALYYACLCLCCILLSSISGARPLTILSLLNANLDQYNNENYFPDQSQYVPDNDLPLPYLSPESSEQKESRVLYYKVPQSSEVGAELDANDNNNGYVYETYGPFPEEQVMDWWRAGYFDSFLLVSDDLAAQFIPMTTFLEEGFSSSPPPPPSPPLATRPSDKEYEIAEILDEETSAASDESLERMMTTTKLKKKGTRKKSSVLRKIAGLGRRAKQASLAFLQDSLTSTSSSSSVQSDQDSSSDWPSHASIEPAPVADSRTYIADPSEHLADEDDGHAQQGKHVRKQSKEEDASADSPEMPRLQQEIESDFRGSKVSVRSLGSDVGGSSDLWPEESRASPWALARVSAAALVDSSTQSAAVLIRLLVLLVPAPLRLAASCLCTLGPSASAAAAAGPATAGSVSVAVCASAALSLHLLRIALQALSLALFGGLVFESAATGSRPSDLFTVDMSAMSGDPDPAAVALRSAQDRCRTIGEHLRPLAEPLLRSLAPFTQWMGCGIAHLFSFVSTIQVRWFKEAVVVDWRDAIASRDLRTMSQYLHGLVLVAAREAAVLYHRGAGHLAALLQLALSLSATHRRSCWAAWVDLTGFLGSNPAAGAFLVAAFSVALIDHALLPAVRARVRTLTVRDDEVRSTNETEKPARNWRYAASAGTAVAVLLTASVALALLSTGQGTVSPLLPVDLTSEPPVVGVVLDETRWLLKMIMAFAVAELYLSGGKGPPSRRGPPEEAETLATHRLGRVKYLSGLLADERCRRECQRWNLVPHVVALLEADRAALQADLTSSPVTATATATRTYTPTLTSSWRMVGWSVAVFYSVAQALRRATHTLTTSGGEGQVDVDFVVFVGRRMQRNMDRFLAPWPLSASVVAAVARLPSALVRALSCLGSNPRAIPAESPSVFPYFSPSKLRVSPSAASSAVLFSLLVLGPLLLWQAFLARLGQANAIAADWAGASLGEQHRSVEDALAEAAEALRAGGPDLAAPREQGPPPPDRPAGIRADHLTVSSSSSSAPGVLIRDLSLHCPRGSLCVVLPDLMCPPSSSWGATGAVRAFLEVVWGGSGQRFRCEGGLELLGRPARDWSPAGLQGEVTYLGDREERLELPAGAVAGWGCSWAGQEDGAQARRFFAAAEVSGAQSTLRSLPQGLATLLAGSGQRQGQGRGDCAVQLTAEEWKRLGLCRALSQPRKAILLLDLTSLALSDSEEGRLLAHLREELRRPGGPEVVLLGAARVNPTWAARFADSIVLLGGDEIGSGRQVSAQAFAAANQMR